ncbi:anthranilate synthase component I [Niallia endozanthoxylica]|uniref:Anthranilate synthase component 1 n=1 Tax=Niallia endozanthoxylica TaxID=2036016 RepID=A0A5J5HTT2_9BACI|nr:anthranilate synthase component I [Niallia endozanthoxylica]KAA9025775.1 anthranilate synthase component I [Niallia endozanthoxylica]
MKLSREELSSGTLIIEEIEGDTLTPISIYQKLRGDKKFLLESSLKHENSGRFSFIGAEPFMELIGNGNSSQIIINNENKYINKKPLEVLKELLPEKSPKPEPLFPFIGGAVGYAGYDAIRQYERIGEVPNDELMLPDVHFLFFEVLVVFDHLEQKVYIVASQQHNGSSREELSDKIEMTKEQIRKGVSEEGVKEVTLSAFQASIPKEQFINHVIKAKKYIEEGDIFQVVLSQRLKAEIEGEPFSLYRKLRVKNPSPYMYYFDFQDYSIAGVSPESLIKVKGRQVITNPIAGTRPRGANDEEDLRLAEGLLADEKELAEHKMLVDLGRNDLGRVCEFGSVEVTKFLGIEKYKHVIHLVSEVEGKLVDTFSPIDALISCLPAGTVSGAPKIRAMEIINEMENSKRGIYSGAIGYVSANGNLDFALAIRTMVIKGKEAYIQAGAGIVYDSIPEKEYEETLHKLQMFLGGDRK